MAVAHVPRWTAHRAYWLHGGMTQHSETGWYGRASCNNVTKGAIWFSAYVNVLDVQKSIRFLGTQCVQEAHSHQDASEC
jgi:hypothetical protein